MKIYIGKNNLKGPAITGSSVLYQGNDVLICSDRSPLVQMSLGEGRLLLLWGHVYALHHANGKISKFNASKDEPVLRELADKADIKGLIKKLEGHFSGAVVYPDKRVIIFGDVYNRKDIFYVLKENSLVASTDLKTVTDIHPPKDYDQEALVNMFHVYGNYAPKKHTIYAGIHRLGVGEYIDYKPGKLTLERFPFEPQRTQDYKEAQLEEYSELLHDAVETRCSTDCNWVFLSSGWDSSSILALLTKLRGASKVRAVTGRCKYSTASGVVNQFEVERAQKIADYFSVPLDVVDIDYTKQEYLDFWKEIRGSLKANHLYSLTSYDYLRLTQHISKNSKSTHSVFNGEISDGAHNIGFSQFATILEHPDLNFREYSDKMASYLFGPSFFSRILKGESTNDFIYNILKSRMTGSSFDDPQKMDDKQRKTRFVESFFLSSQRFPFLSISNSKLLTAGGREQYQTLMNETYLKDFVDAVTPESLYAWILHLYNSFHWQGGTVKGMFNASEHYHLDVSMPFWDTRLQSFLSAMPESWGRGLDLNPTKYPLKWTLKNKVDYPFHLQVGPHSYLYDINPSWSADADMLYGPVAKPYFKEIIKDYQYENVLKSSHFNLDYLRKLTDDYVKDKEVSGQERTDLKNLVSLSMVGWY